MNFTTDRHGRRYEQQKDVPFFQEVKNGKPTGRPLSYDATLKNLKITINKEFPEMDSAATGTHVFRRFGATLAKCNGLPDDLIQFMGRWVSETFKRYFMFSDQNKVDMSASLLPG
jgi:hypothetical protein